MTGIDDMSIETILPFENTETFNRKLKEAFSRAEHKGVARYSHFFGGRHENIYIDRAEIPEIEPLIDQVLSRASNHIGQASKDLKVGFWFNKMGPGHRTGPHCHSDYDELLSAVYYVDVPEHSGDLIVNTEEGEICIPAQEGNLVLFNPEYEHEVTKNCSHKTRLSIAFNIGPLDA